MTGVQTCALPISAGSNTLDREERGTYKDTLKTRADDPRNWEFHYSEPGRQAAKNTKGEQVSAAGMTSRARGKAKSAATRAARLSGQSIYDVREIQFNTAGIKAGTAQASKDSKAAGVGRFGSTRTATNLAAQKSASNRRGAAKTAGNVTTAARGKPTGPFDAAKPKKRGMG